MDDKIDKRKRKCKVCGNSSYGFNCISCYVKPLKYKKKIMKEAYNETN